MVIDIRSYDEQDRDAVVALSLGAWAPVFVSLEQILGPSGLFAWMHPDWREHQRNAVQAALADADLDVQVAEVDGTVAGFVAVRIDQASRMGEIHPRHGGRHDRHRRRSRPRTRPPHLRACRVHSAAYYPVLQAALERSRLA